MNGSRQLLDVFVELRSDMSLISRSASIASKVYYLYFSALVTIVMRLSVLFEQYYTVLHRGYCEELKLFV